MALRFDFDYINVIKVYENKKDGVIEVLVSNEYKDPPLFLILRRLKEGHWDIPFTNDNLIDETVFKDREESFIFQNELSLWLSRMRVISAFSDTLDELYEKGELK